MEDNIKMDNRNLGLKIRTGFYYLVYNPIASFPECG
jgi:hypothetical protein